MSVDTTHHPTDTPRDQSPAQTNKPAPEAGVVGVEGHDAAPTAAPVAAHAGEPAEPHFVTPASYLRPLSSRSAVVSNPGANTAAAMSSSGGGAEPSTAGPGLKPAPAVGAGEEKKSVSLRDGRPILAVDRDQLEGLRAIRAFLKVRTSYDVLPLSYRLIVFDTSLLVKKSLNILTQCAIVSAPLWDSKTSTFAGLLTVSDYINVIQYYWQNPDALAQIDQFKLNSLREIERAIGVNTIETVSIHPLRPLYEACTRMLQARARRIPLVDVDDETQREMVVSLVTQYRILKFVSVNVPQTQMLRKPLRDIKMGTYDDLVTTTMETPVMEVIHQLVKKNISCVPILGPEGTVLNVFEAVDVLVLIKNGDYDKLNYSVGKALELRSEDFPGIYTCTVNDRLDTIFDTIRKSRVHRLIILDEGKYLKGVLSLSDILDYTLNSPIGDEED